MRIDEAQSEVGDVYMGGFVGQLVSAVVWAVSAFATAIVSPNSDMFILVIGGMVIFPVP